MRRRFMVTRGVEIPDNGVYIQDVDGHFFTSNEWDGTRTPNCIAVITDNCRFGIALEDVVNLHSWGGYGTKVSDIVTSTSISTAAADYAGETNTTTIINALGTGNAPAAECCRAYTFPDGSIGYLGAAGEWRAALNNESAIATALSKCGGTAMSGTYWTSTQYSSDRSWYAPWVVNMVLQNYYKTSAYGVRAFSAI